MAKRFSDQMNCFYLIITFSSFHGTILLMYEIVLFGLFRKLPNKYLSLSFKVENLVCVRISNVSPQQVN